MSKETAKKLITELQTNEELKKKVDGIAEPEELVKKAVEAGYDVTLEELEAAEKEIKAELASKNDELSADELEAAAGGHLWKADEASDGHELICAISYHKAGWIIEHNEYCKSYLYNDERELRKNEPVPGDPQYPFPN